MTDLLNTLLVVLCKTPAANLNHSSLQCSVNARGFERGKQVCESRRSRSRGPRPPGWLSRRWVATSRDWEQPGVNVSILVMWFGRSLVNTLSFWSFPQPFPLSREPHEGSATSPSGMMGNQPHPPQPARVSPGERPR